MSTAKQVKAFCSSAIAVVMGMLCLMTATASRCTAQAQAQHAEVPTAIAKELNDIKAQVGQLESKVNYLASVIPSTAAAANPNLPEPKQVTLTGRVSCGHCEGVQPVHKGYTPFSWALYSVSQGDDIVLVASDKTYTLQGDQTQLLKLMSDKAQVTGRLESTVLRVEKIEHAPKQK